MKARDVLAQRLANQRILHSNCANASEVVSTLTAMQAQDYRGALWAIGLRFPGSTVALVERAIAQREIVRTWPMRGTLHFVAAEDVRWMLRLLTPRVIRSTAGRHRQLELDAPMFTKSRRVLGRELRDGGVLTRPEAYAALERAEIATGAMRGIHILSQLAQEGMLCFGEHRGRQPTFALLDAWVPASRDLRGAEAIAELTRRYFASHGPATLRDFVWWCGLTITEARAGIASLGEVLSARMVGDATYYSIEPATPMSRSSAVHLLPGFDEYLLGYRDRAIILDAEHSSRVVPGANGIFYPTVIVSGRVAGLWKPATTGESLEVVATPFDEFSARTRKSIAIASTRYRQFIARD